MANKLGHRIKSNPDGESDQFLHEASLRTFSFAPLQSIFSRQLIGHFLRKG